MTNHAELHAIDAQTLKQWLQDSSLKLIDVREAVEYATERIPGAALHPLSQFNPDLIHLSEGQKLVL